MSEPYGYTGGTVALTNGSAAVTGALTAWGDLLPGDEIEQDGVRGVVDVVVGNTALTLRAPWAGASYTGAAYVVLHRSGLRHDVARLSERYARWHRERPNFILTTGQPDNGVGGDKWIAFDPATRTLYTNTLGVWDGGLVTGQGPQGVAGAQGPQGDAGPQGPQGVAGAQGPQGVAGAQGPQGDAGPQGPQGVAGAQGPQGNTGPGVAAGGTTGQVLAKTGGADYETGWVNLPAPGGADGQVQFRAAGSFAGAAGFTFDSGTGLLTAPHASAADVVLTGLNPPTPAADTAKLFARKAGRVLPGFVGPSGLASALQPHLGRNKIGYWNPPGNTTGLPGVFGMAAPTTAGTVTARSVATTNLATRLRRLGLVSAATNPALAQMYWSALQHSVGDGAGLGGFTFETTFVMSNAASRPASRAFVGFSTSVVAATNVEPSTLTTCFGLAKLSTSTNWHIVYGGSAAQAPIDLGADFPADTQSADAYHFVLFCPPSSSDVHWYLERLGTAFAASGVIVNSGSAVLPAATDLLAPRLWHANNGAYAVGIDVANVYIETDY